MNDMTLNDSSEQRFSAYDLRGDLNPYEWSLTMAGAEVLAFGEFGSYQGDWLAKVRYDGQEGWIHDYYGSCSGCDAYEAESGWDDKTKDEWIAWAKDFGKGYLDAIRNYEEVHKEAAENLEWDMDAKEMVAFLEAHK